MMDFEDIKADDYDENQNPVVHIIEQDQVMNIAEQDELEKRRNELSGHESIQLISFLTENDIQVLKSLFEKYPKKQMDKIALHLWLQELLKGVPKAEECLKVVFYKLQADCQQRISWTDFLFYLMLENMTSIRNVDNYLPVVEKPIKDIPKFHKSRHRHPIIRIAFQAFVRQDREIDYSSGKYYTVSYDGLIIKWDINFKKEARFISSCITLDVAKTMVTDLVCLSDMNIICVSSTERELRFYDVTGKTFNLRAMVCDIDQSIVTMHYHFFNDLRQKSILIAGDIGGNIKIFEISPINNGPFRLRPGYEFLPYKYPSIWRGKTQGIKIREIRKIHNDWVFNVGFYAEKKWIISCSRATKRSLVLSDLRTLEPMFILNIQNGVSCFWLEPSTSMIYAGGKDYMIRAWHLYSPKIPKLILSGHLAPVRTIFTQRKGKLIYSLDANQVIKVWDANTGWCMQTLGEQLREIGDGPLVSFYNPWARILYVACMGVAAIKVGYAISKYYTDGYTHTQPVTKLLVHPQMQAVVSFGMDSSILVWNPINGKRIETILHAHSKYVDGVFKTIGITAATFDPTYVYLLTGAMDGSVKMWDFFRTTCVRNMVFANEEFVTSLTWVPQRIFASGWTNYIIEWEDSKSVGPSKIWPTNHYDHIHHTSLCWPLTFVTASEVGELIFCRISTGQPYRRHIVSKPKQIFNANFTDEDFDKRLSISSYSSFGSARRSAFRRQLVQPRRATLIPLPVSGYGGEKISVKCLLTLRARPMEPDVGTLLVSLETGYIQLWSHHPVGGYMTSIYAIHSAADYVRVMATTETNKYLFTGHAAGYIKVWLLTNFGMPGPKVKVSMPKLRLRFPFLLKDKIEKRAKRAVRFQNEPLLLSSFRAHIRGVSDIAILEENKIFATSSWDKTVRVWTYGGQYIGTLGTFRRWPELQTNEPAFVSKYRMPPDVKRIVSSTTLKVMTNGFDNKKKGKLKNRRDIKFEQMLHERTLKKPIYGDHPSEPILGRFYNFEPLRTTAKLTPQVDITSAQMGFRVFEYYTIYDVETVTRPPTPVNFDREVPQRDSKFEAYETTSSIEQALMEEESSSSEEEIELEEEVSEEELFPEEYKGEEGRDEEEERAEGEERSISTNAEVDQDDLESREQVVDAEEEDSFIK